MAAELNRPIEQRILVVPLAYEPQLDLNVDRTVVEQGISKFQEMLK